MTTDRKLPRLCIIVPCFNEEETLPLSAPEFAKVLDTLVEQSLVSRTSFVLFVDDGSSDTTWEIIKSFANSNGRFEGLKLSRNRGHQNALLAGLLTVQNYVDCAISVDCDLQDDLFAMSDMLRCFSEGSDIVYGVRNDRSSDSFFKRFSAESFYWLINKMGVESVFNHADYRLLSSRAIKGLAHFPERNLFLRGLVPLIGYKSSTVEYQRSKRIAGQSHYPLSKMVGLALDGVTSLSIKPIRIVSYLGFITFCASLVGIIWSCITFFAGNTVSGWTSLLCVILFLGGINLLALGTIGEYIGRIYLETKRRPHFIIEESTLDA